MKTHFLRDIILICAGVVTGSLVASLTAGTKALSWLSYGLTFGTKTPFSLELGVVELTFGLSINITIATIIFVALLLVIGRAIIK